MRWTASLTVVHHLVEELKEVHVLRRTPKVLLQDSVDARLQHNAIVDRHQPHLQPCILAHHFRITCLAQAPA